MKSAEERFYEKVNKNGPVPAHRPELGPCHPWTGAMSGGYGRFCLNGKTVNAGRAALFFAAGVLPENALHHCDNTACVRREHLYDGSKVDNARDREARQRGNHATGERHGCATHPSLHAGENNGRAKVTEVDAWSIREALAGGKVSAAELAEAFDLTPTAIGDIAHGDLWPKAGGPVVPREGYARGARHGNAAFTEEQAATLRAEHTGRYGEQKMLAERYGVDVQTIRRVVRGRTYASAGGV